MTRWGHDGTGRSEPRSDRPVTRARRRTREVKQLEKKYVVHSEAWYAPQNPLPAGAVEEVLFTLEDNGAVVGEARFTWYDLGRRLAPRLEAFDDAWPMLDHLAHYRSHRGFFFAALGNPDDTDVRPAELCARLRDFGFEDATPRSSPDPEGPLCSSHGLAGCNAPECVGVLLSEVRDAELWAGTE